LVDGHIVGRARGAVAQFNYAVCETFADHDDKWDTKQFGVFEFDARTDTRTVINEYVDATRVQGLCQRFAVVNDRVLFTGDDQVHIKGGQCGWPAQSALIDRCFGDGADQVSGYVPPKA
jgi:hypothetical protein